MIVRVTVIAVMELVIVLLDGKEMIVTNALVLLIVPDMGFVTMAPVIVLMDGEARIAHKE